MISTALKILGRTAPTIPWRHYTSRAARSGLRRPYFLLSFDCDTDRDIEVADEVHRRLAAVGVTPVYAVPGELLERGAHVYAGLAQQGAEFLNHGYRQHTIYDAPSHTYVSTLFYDRLTAAELAEDVERGHESVRRVTGQTPSGFRTPHFGTFQQPEQLASLYAILSRLGYEFSTSTLPLTGIMHGPAQRAGSLWELPVSGGFRWPLALLDSYGFRFAPNRKLNEDDFDREMSSVLRYFITSERPGFLNYYADPSQVYDWPRFFELMAVASRFAIPSYRPILDAIE